MEVFPNTSGKGSGRNPPPPSSFQLLLWLCVLASPPRLTRNSLLGLDGKFLLHIQFSNENMRVSLPSQDCTSEIILLVYWTSFTDNII